MKRKFGAISLAITIASFFAWPVGNASADTFVAKKVNCLLSEIESEDGSYFPAESMAHTNVTTATRNMTIQVTKDGCKPKSKSKRGEEETGIFFFIIKGGVDDPTQLITLNRTKSGSRSVTFELKPNHTVYPSFRSFVGYEVSGTFDYQYSIQ